MAIKLETRDMRYRLDPKTGKRKPVDAPNPFRRKRRPNGATRFLNKREAAMHPSLFDRDGNLAR